MTDEPTHGVGPWRGKLPDGDHFDPELLASGDTRNVVDEYRYWTMEAIVADLDSRRHAFHVAIENWQHDMNIGSIVRSANAFLANTVHIVGRRRWNRRGAMVTDRYQRVIHHPDVDTFQAWMEERGIPIIAVDNISDAVPVDERISRRPAHSCSARRARGSPRRRSPRRARTSRSPSTDPRAR